MNIKTKPNLSQLQKTIKQIKDQINILDKERTTLADLIDKSKDILESWDLGIESLENGYDEMKRGLDDLASILN